MDEVLEAKKRILNKMDLMAHEAEKLEDILYHAHKESVLIDSIVYTIDGIVSNEKYDKLDKDMVKQLEEHIDSMKKWLVEAVARVVNIEEAFHDILSNIKIIEDNK